MEGADKYFARVLRGLRPALVKNGFRQSSQNFVLESSGSWGIVNFQKSRWSQPDEKTFYVNVAATPKRLLAFDDEPANRAPAYWKCIWYCRAEQFGPEPKIQQWTVRDEQTSNEVTHYLERLICEFAIPIIRHNMHEAALLNMWSNESAPYYPHLKAKAVLHSYSGDTEGLRETIQFLRDQFGSGATAVGVEDHIEKLRKKFPDAMKSIP